LAWWWWLRSPGYSTRSVATVFLNGEMQIIGSDANHEGGVRPALWLNI
jgi:hypothetical protein